MLGERGLGLVVRIPSGCVAKINILWLWPRWQLLLLQLRCMECICADIGKDRVFYWADPAARTSLPFSSHELSCVSMIDCHRPRVTVTMTVGHQPQVPAWSSSPGSCTFLDESSCVKPLMVLQTPLYRFHRGPVRLCDACETLAVMYLQWGPPIAENESTTHRTHRTHRTHSDQGKS